MKKYIAHPTGITGLRNVDIDMTIPYCNGHRECEKLIAPMLSDILGESIVVSSEDCSTFPNGFCHVTFRENNDC